jgi:hypothetical protein
MASGGEVWRDGEGRRIDQCLYGFCSYIFLGLSVASEAFSAVAAVGALASRQAVYGTRQASAGRLLESLLMRYESSQDRAGG